MQLASVVAVVVAGAAGFATGHWTASPGSESPAPQSQDVVLRRLDRLESSISDWIRGIETARPVSPAAVERTPDAPAPLESSKVLAALDGLKSAVAELQAQFAETGRSAIPDAIAIPKNASALARIFPVDAAGLAQLRERHFCWTPMQVYRTYGIPDAAQSGKSDEAIWGYQLADGTKLYFIFSSGVVLTATTEAPFRIRFPNEK